MAAAVKLESWLRGVHFQDTSATRIARAGSEPSGAPRREGENEIMIIAKGSHELLILLADAGTNRVRLSEIEGRAGDVSDLPGRDELVVDRREAFSGDHHFVLEYIGARSTP